MIKGAMFAPCKTDWRNRLMKRLKLILVLIILLSFTGCIQEYNYTAEESDAIAEYMAGRVLAEDHRYGQALAALDELTPENGTKDKLVHTVVTGNSVSTNKQTVNIKEVKKTDSGTEVGNNLSSILGGKYFDVNYKSHELTEIYPNEEENPYFSLTARTGYRLLVVLFTVSNKTDQEREFNLSTTDVDYQLDADESTVYKPQFTLLENDLRYIDVMIGPKKSSEALLVFEISKQIDVSNMKLTVTRDKSTSTVKIK